MTTDLPYITGAFEENDRGERYGGLFIKFHDCFGFDVLALRIEGVLTPEDDEHTRHVFLFSKMFVDVTKGTETKSFKFS